MTTNTNTAGLPKRQIFTEFHDIIPTIGLEIKEYKKAIIQDIDHRSKKKGKDQLRKIRCAHGPNATRILSI